MTLPVDLRTSLRPQAGLASDRLGLTVYLAVAFQLQGQRAKNANQSISHSI